MKIILASASPRRKQLLSMVVQNFEIIVSNVDEKIEDNLTPEEQTTHLAYIKARDVYERTDGDRIIIGSDTLVAKNGKVYGKPSDKQQAKEMIKELIDGNKTHSVFTGLCIIIEKDGKYEEYKTFDEVKVFFKEITDAEIDKWIDSGKAMDKAGAYAIQDEFCVHIEKIEGNYTSIVGLPTHKIYDKIKDYIN